MSEEKFEKIKQEIAEIIKNSPVKEDPIHSIHTLKWLMYLMPTADEAMQIAALGHDIDRAVFTKIDDESKISDYELFKKEHAVRSSKVLTDLLHKYEFKKKFIVEVDHLVKNHEVGGDKKSDVIRDADSISFFEDQLEGYLEKNGLETSIRKFRYMYERSSNEAKAIIKSLGYNNPIIEKLIKEL